MAWRENAKITNLEVDKLKLNGPIQGAGFSTGNVWYVDSGSGSDGGGKNGRTIDSPFATLDYAIGKCTASNGDIIYLLPGHTETLAASGNIALLDVAGVTVIGLGIGTLIPTFNLGHASATLSITAANCHLYNVRIVSTIADVAVGITMGAASDGSIVERCVFRDTAADKEMLVGISVAALAVGVKLLYNDFKTTAAAGGNNAILSAANTDLQVIGNTAYGKFATGAMLTSGVLTQATITDNIFVNAEAAIAIALNGTTSTGILARNMLGGTTSIAAALTGDDAMWCFENYVTGAAAASGALNPDVDAD